jgi:exonuclease III
MDSNGILIWNVRGLNDRAKRDSIKSLVLDTMPSIVCPQETKLSSISDFDIITILGSTYSNFIFSPAIGTRVGILVAWRDRNLSTGVSVIKEFSVSVQFQLLSGQLWWFTGVYGPHQDNLKLAFLQELGVVRNECEGPWIIAGDFNMIYRAKDKNNSNINRALMGDFRSWINSLELKEILLCGRRFTWSNQREDPTLAKVDYNEEFVPIAQMESVQVFACYCGSEGMACPSNGCQVDVSGWQAQGGGVRPTAVELCRCWARSEGPTTEEGDVQASPGAAGLEHKVGQEFA